MTSEHLQDASPHRGRPLVLWLVIAAIILPAIAFSWNPTPLAQALAAIFIACALVHASAFYRPRQALTLLAICLAITFAMENLGTATGFPFGHYHFEVDAGLPHLGLIPIIVGPLWFGAGYFSWVVATILLDGADRALGRRFNLIALPIVAALVMTQWDLVMDARNATIARVWIWHDGGSLYGVPLSNYLGWFLTSWLFFQAFALYLRRQDKANLLGASPSRKLRAIAVLFYVSAGLTHLIPWIMGPSGEVADGAGHLWRIADIREGTVAIMLFTMLFTAMLAAFRLFDAANEDRTAA
ncbi:MAG: carotenoid biosynthesis protein [Bradyrhizobium sp.]|nr:carotenoid biosynthesis protein [Bradyrhizobium sp.]